MLFLLLCVGTSLVEFPLQSCFRVEQILTLLPLLATTPSYLVEASTSLQLVRSVLVGINKVTMVTDMT